MAESTYGWGCKASSPAQTRPGSAGSAAPTLSREEEPHSPPASPTALDPFPQSPGTHSVTKELSAKPIRGIRPEDSCNSLPIASVLSSHQLKLLPEVRLRDPPQKKCQWLPVATRALTTCSGGKALGSQHFLEHS